MAFSMMTMADNSLHKPKNLPEDIWVSQSNHDTSNDTNNVAEESVFLQFDTMDEGGLVAASPSHHIPLFHLLNGLERDVYYAIETAQMHDSGTLSLVLAVKDKFLEIDPASFLAMFKRCLLAQKFKKHEHFFVTAKAI